MSLCLPDESLERFSYSDLIGALRDWIAEATRLRVENEKLTKAFAELRAENENLGGALAKLKTEHQTLRDELARLKKLPPRPTMKPSGMEKATQAEAAKAASQKGERSTRRRGSQLDKLTITRDARGQGESAGGLAQQRLRGHRDPGLEL